MRPTMTGETTSSTTICAIVSAMAWRIMTVPSRIRLQREEQQQHQRHKHVGQIQVQAAALDDAQAVGQTRHEPDDRPIEIDLKHRFNMKDEVSAFGEILRLLKKFGFKFHGRLIDRAEYALDRLDKAGGRVFHARGEAEAASPRFEIALPAKAA